MYVSSKAYGWTDADGCVYLSLFPASHVTRPRNAYASREEATADVAKRRHRMTGENPYEIVWEN